MLQKESLFAPWGSNYCDDSSAPRLQRCGKFREPKTQAERFHVTSGIVTSLNFSYGYPLRPLGFKDLKLCHLAVLNSVELLI